MHKPISSLICLSLLSTFFVLWSCSKPEKNSTIPPPNFTWTYNGNTYTADLDSAYVHYDLTPYLIQAITGTNFNTFFTRKLFFSLSSFGQGSYVINTGNIPPNIINYIDELGFSHSGVSGSLNITSYANNLISGNFSCILAAAPANLTITGNFSNVPVRP